MKIERVSLVFVMSFYWLCLCNHSIFLVSSLCLDNQRSLLLQLKNNLTHVISYPSDEPISNKLKFWNATSEDCCRWMGVTCDKEGRVTGLDLSGESITGGIGNNSSLFHLQHLQNLNLAQNEFTFKIIPSGFNKLENLRYLNLSDAGFEGQIPIEISQLTRLVTLDLSSTFGLEIPNLRKLVQNLTSIKKLYLDGVSITTPGEEWSNALLSLSSLQVLSLSECNLSGPLDASLARLENLSIIILDNNQLSSPVPELFASLKNLTILNLAGCELIGTFPQKIFQIATLSFIDISRNYDLHGVFLDPLSGSLQALTVSRTNFSGAFPYSIVNMAHLSVLDLSYCQFNGTLPYSLSSLTTMSYLDLSANNFTGPMPSFGMAKKLTHLDLSHNGFSGPIPSSLFTLPLLQNLQLSHNQFSQLDTFSNVSSFTLDALDIGSNNLSGPFPVLLIQLSALSSLRLSFNMFNGSVQLKKILELKNLTALDLSYNNLTVNVDLTNFDPSSFPQLSELNLASCNLKTFPGYLRNQSSLSTLDLSNNLIQGIVPNWIWKLPLSILNISHNLLTNLEGPLENLTCRLAILDVHNNQLQGSIPVFPESLLLYMDYSMNKFTSVIPQGVVNDLSSILFLSLSNNNFHGSIPDSLCNASQLLMLDLSTNNISGAIPSCLIEYTPQVLNPQKNNLTGRIPDMFPASCHLKTLNLDGNSLEGPIPKSLSHCSDLEVLDLGTNQLIDGFPCFLNNLSTLRVMVLRNNEFQGSLGCLKAKGTWKKLQIMDIAFNNFRGKLLGNYFTNWETIKHEAKSEFERVRVELMDGTYYENSVTVVIKGIQRKLVKILRVFTCIDFSSNHFEGSIPKELMYFKGLHVFNLSNNAFSGEIPASIGNLENIESLDLSMNNLHGEVPVQLSSLTFLSYLNLSFNHLKGKIPTGTQLQSFQPSSFEGNDGLYGPPLTEEPKGKNQGLQPQPSCGKLIRKIDWNFLSAELGLVSGLFAFFFPLLFWKPWRVWYWEIVDEVLCWIFPQLYHEYVTRRGQSYRVLRWRR